jgi:parallel beta-helix repeat protein
MRRLLGLGSLAALAVVTLFALSAAPALGNHVQCGDTITQDTRLDSDLIDCPGAGLIIGADNVHLDLGGHTIMTSRSFTDLRPGDPEFFRAGVENGRVLGSEPGYRGVTIENGVIQGFQFGVSLEHASHSLVRGLTLRASRYETIDLYYADKNRIENNSISGHSAAGILLEAQSHKNRIVGNSISNDIFGGISLFLESNDNWISENVISHTNDGIAVWANENRIGGNSVSYTGVGIEAGGTQNRIEDNDVSWTIGSEPGGAGIWIGGDGGNVVRRNVASHNQDDGIRVLSPGVTVTANSTNFNGDFGIQAVEGVIDGGRNTAFGNTNPLQCLNVVCK